MFGWPEDNGEGEGEGEGVQRSEVMLAAAQITPTFGAHHRQYSRAGGRHDALLLPCHSDFR